ELREDIAEATAAAGLAFAAAGLAAKILGEIETAEVHIRLRTASAARSRTCARKSVGRIETILVVHLALLGIAQDVVSFLHVLEALFGRFVSRVQIGMILPRQLAIGLSDFIERRVAGHTQRLIIILVCSHKRNSYQLSAISYQPIRLG